MKKYKIKKIVKQEIETDVSLKEMICYNLIKLRKNRNLTQREVANTIGMTRTNLCNIERGTTSLAIETLYNICSVYKCSLLDILPPLTPPLPTKEYGAFSVGRAPFASIH